MLVGHSMGGMTMMSLAEQHPELDPRAGHRGGLRRHQRRRPRRWSRSGFGQLRSARSSAGSGRGVLDRLRAPGRRWSTPCVKPGRDVEDFIVERYSFASPVPPSSVRYTGDMIFGTPLDGDGRLPARPSTATTSARRSRTFHGVETLVVNGMQDLLTPPEHSEEIVRLHPRGRARRRQRRRPHHHARAPRAGHRAAPRRWSSAGLRAAAEGSRRSSASRGCAAPSPTSRSSAGWPGPRRRAAARGARDGAAWRCPPPRTPGRWGARLGALLRAGDLVVLTGGLGAGKTTLTQGIAEGLGVRGPVTSPTFVIARVHPSLVGGPALVHVDAYRLGGVAELDDLDLDASLDERDRRRVGPRPGRGPERGPPRGHPRRRRTSAHGRPSRPRAVAGPASRGPARRWARSLGSLTACCCSRSTPRPRRSPSPCTTAPRCCAESLHRRRPRRTPSTLAPASSARPRRGRAHRRPTSPTSSSASARARSPGCGWAWSRRCTFGLRARHPRARRVQPRRARRTQALAEPAASQEVLVVATDARRKEVYWARYRAARRRRAPVRAADRARRSTARPTVGRGR